MKINLSQIKQRFSLSPGSNVRGFSLIEVMIAVLILFIIVFAFTPLLVGSIERIRYAGDKSEAIAQSQAVLESDISYRETIDGYEVTFTFGKGEDKTIIKVPGGFIDSPQTEGSASAWLKTFIPYVPSITLSNPFLAEGYNGDGSTNYLLTHIMGTETKLSGGGNVYIYTRDGFNAGSSSAYNLPFTYLGSTPPSGLPSTYDDYIAFDLPARFSGLTNAHSPYIVELKWLVNSITVTVLARLHITLPEAVVVGNSVVDNSVVDNTGTIIVSPDANIIWNSRNNASSMAFNINDIIWYDFSYLAVTSTGKALRWGNQEEPTLIDTPVSTSLNSLVYGQGKIVAVGDSGVILVSDNGSQTWVSKASGTTENLRSVSYNNDAQEFLAVGPNGTLLRSADANLWELSTITAGSGWINLNLAGATYYNGSWFLAGDRSPSDNASVSKSVIMKEDINDTSIQWIAVFSGEPTGNWLNDISGAVIDEDGNFRFIAVGNSGQIVTSNDGESWDVSAYGNGEYRTVIWDNHHDINQYFLVGNNGLLVSGTPGNWVTRATGSSANLKGVAIRWEN